MLEQGNVQMNLQALVFTAFHSPIYLSYIICAFQCGGAIEVRNCYICGAQIGGTGHTLLNTNTRLDLE